MSLIICPECHNKISDRADFCPHCGLPHKDFNLQNKAEGNNTESIELTFDMSALRNNLIAFEHSYQVCFGTNHYITAMELDGLKSSFSVWAEKLKDKALYNFCKENAPKFAVDYEM